MNPLIAFHAVMAAWHLSWIAFWLRQFPSPSSKEQDRRSVPSQQVSRPGIPDSSTADSAGRWLRGKIRT